MPVHKVPLYNNGLKLVSTKWAASNVPGLTIHPLVYKENLHQISKILHKIDVR